MRQRVDGQKIWSTVPVYNRFIKEEIIYRYRPYLSKKSKFSSYELHQQMKIGQPKMVFHLYSIFKIDHFPLHLQLGGSKVTKRTTHCVNVSAVRKTKTLNTQIFKFLSYELHRYEVEVTIRRHI